MSMDSAVATISSEGVVTARGAGTIAIKAMEDGIIVSCKITVTE